MKLTKWLKDCILSLIPENVSKNYEKIRSLVALYQQVMSGIAFGKVKLSNNSLFELIELHNALEMLELQYCWLILQERCKSDIN